MGQHCGGCASTFNRVYLDDVETVLDDVFLKLQETHFSASNIDLATLDEKSFAGVQCVSNFTVAVAFLSVASDCDPVQISTLSQWVVL